MKSKNYLIYKTKPYSVDPSYSHLEIILQWWDGEWITNLYSKVTKKHFQHRPFHNQEDAERDFINREYLPHPPESPWKRGHWSNDEIIGILERNTYPDPTTVGEYEVNHALEFIIDEFRGFKMSDQEFGAMAYNMEDGNIYHVGPLPPL